MSEKKCFKCGTVKSLDQFYRHSKMGDGHLGKCIECTKRDVDEREKRLRASDPEWLARERERCREKQTKRRAAGLCPLTDIERERIKKWGRDNNYKRRAQTRSNRAQARGELIKPVACEACGATDVALEKHHPDYSRPLYVQWLCKKCHGVTRWLSKASKAVEAAQQELFK